MIAVLHPSFWQQTAAGLVAILVLVITGALGLVWLARAILDPWISKRALPEGARWVGFPASLLVDLARAPVGGDARLEGYREALRFGLVVATCAVVPLSTGLVTTQPGWGIFVLPVALAVEALLGGFKPPSEDGERSFELRAGRVGLAAVVGLAAGVVMAQWGTGSLSEVVVAQRDGTIFGVAGWGLPTAWVQPAAFVVAIVALHAIGVCRSAAPMRRFGGSVGALAEIIDAAWLVAGSAWVVAAFGGGGSVPWQIANDGVRQFVAVAMFVAKLTVVGVVGAWAQRRWPVISIGAVRRIMVGGAMVGVASIGLTLVIRSLV